MKIVTSLSAVPNLFCFNGEARPSEAPRQGPSYPVFVEGCASLATRTWDKTTSMARMVAAALLTAGCAGSVWPQLLAHVCDG